MYNDENSKFYKSGDPNYFESSSSSSFHRHNAKQLIYKRIPIYDNATTNLSMYAPTIVSFIHTALYHGSVLVHCQRGISRSTCAVIMYLIHKVGYTYNQAYNLCKLKRPIIQPIPAFVNQLQIYELQCRQMNTTSGNKRKRKLIGTTTTKEPTRRRRYHGPQQPHRGGIIGPTIMSTSTTMEDMAVIGPTLPSPSSSSTAMCTTDDEVKHTTTNVVIGPSIPDRYSSIPSSMTTITSNNNKNKRKEDKTRNGVSTTLTCSRLPWTFLNQN